jgi:hypothetical protein
MKLRDHPLMTRRSGMNNWPPRWTKTTSRAQDKPRGEVGTLQRVAKHPSIENGLFLWIEYQDSSYVGAMFFDDLAFCHIMRRILDSHIGLSIKDIGNLDLSFTL